MICKEHMVYIFNSCVYFVGMLIECTQFVFYKNLLYGNFGRYAPQNLDSYKETD